MLTTSRLPRCQLLPFRTMAELRARLRPQLGSTPRASVSVEELLAMDADEDGVVQILAIRPV